MNAPRSFCVRGCKELCAALEIASQQEKDAILKYGTLRDECSYPDVKVMLNELILLREKSIRLLEETKSLLRTKFEILDQVREGFEM